MKYCLSVGLHNLYFDIAIVDNNHNIVSKHKCDYDRNKDISNNIYLAYKKYYSSYKIVAVGVGISNNINFKDNILFSVKSFSFKRYDLKQSLSKLFKIDVFLLEETHLAALSVSEKLDCNSLLYVILDNKISNSFIIDHEIIDLENDINLREDKILNDKCGKQSFKFEFLKLGYDDEYIGGKFFSKEIECRDIIRVWAMNLNKELEKIVKELPINKIVFSGYLGEYYRCFKGYLLISNKIECLSINNHREETLKGISHLIFKDK